MDGMNWDDLRLFLAVARKGGLAAAAEATGKSPPTLGRRMLALERAVGAELFHRLARGYELTGQGENLLNAVTRLEAQIDPLAKAPGRRRRTLVKVSAGTWMTRFICQNATSVLGDDPRLSLRFISADHVLDIVRREAVIGIRNHRPEQIGLACRRVGRVRFAGYAVSEAITPWARVIGKTPSARWLAANADIDDSVEVISPRNALDLAEAGLVRALLPTFVGDAEPSLMRVTPEIQDLEHDQWLVTHHEERFEPSVRTVIQNLHTLVATRDSVD